MRNRARKTGPPPPSFLAPQILNLENKKKKKKKKKQKKKLTAPRPTAFCPLTSTTHPSAAANCSSPCSVAFYTNAHDFAPASRKQFQDSYLSTQTAYWIERFNLGYRALVACGEAVGNAERTGSAGAGFAARPTGDVTGDVTGGGVAAVATTTTTGSPAGTGGASAGSAAVAESGRSGGSVVEGDVKTAIALGVLGLVAAAVLL